MTIKYHLIQANIRSKFYTKVGKRLEKSRPSSLQANLELGSRETTLETDLIQAKIKSKANTRLVKEKCVCKFPKETKLESDLVQANIQSKANTRLVKGECDCKIASKETKLECDFTP